MTLEAKDDLISPEPSAPRSYPGAIPTENRNEKTKRAAKKETVIRLGSNMIIKNADIPRKTDISVPSESVIKIEIPTKKVLLEGYGRSLS